MTFSGILTQPPTPLLTLVAPAFSNSNIPPAILTLSLLFCLSKDIPEVCGIYAVLANRSHQEDWWDTKKRLCDVLSGITCHIGAGDQSRLKWQIFDILGQYGEREESSVDVSSPLMANT